MSYNDFEGFFENEEDEDIPLLTSFDLKIEIDSLKEELARKEEILKLTLELEHLQQVRMHKILEGEE
tara:strand:- start:168 stop:368 length:201 start_codon:yes stop_codon:yes gene_type:complete